MNYSIPLKIVILVLLIFLLIKIQYKNIENFTNNTYNGIPKVIYQIYLSNNTPYTKKIPNILNRNIRHIKSLNKDWEYKLYNDKMAINFIKKYYGKKMLSIYNKINPKYGPARSDLFRYLLLYQKGGVYLDIKSGMNKPLNNIITEKDTYYLSYWRGKPSRHLYPPNGELQQWYIITPPKHPFLKEVINNVCDRILNDKVIRTGKIGVLYLTGPFVYTETITKLLPKYKYKLYNNNVELGFKYRNINMNHVNIFKSHYTRLNEPIILK